MASMGANKLGSPVVESSQHTIPIKPSATEQRRQHTFSCGLFEYVLEFISRTNLFLLCCIASCLTLISYLAAFSCEISWILEAHGNLPTASYLLCSGYFILFVASTILIHGLATGLPWGLFSWSVIIGALGVPELCLVMVITTQFWGLQSIHGLTELVGYIIRLIINCMALLCVIPTALHWHREQQVLKQLQDLARRLQIQTQPPGVPQTNTTLQHQCELQRHQQQQQSIVLSRQGSRSTGKRRHSGIDNTAYIVHESQLPFSYAYGVYGSENEFNASVFGSNSAIQNGGRSRSLLDLRNVPQVAHPATGESNMERGNKLADNASDTNEPMYYTIGSEKDTQITDVTSSTAGLKSLLVPRLRNCVSMDNLSATQQHAMMQWSTDARSANEHRLHRFNANLMQQHPFSHAYQPQSATAHHQHQQQPPAFAPAQFQPIMVNASSPFWKIPQYTASAYDMVHPAQWAHVQHTLNHPYYQLARHPQHVPAKAQPHHRSQSTMNSKQSLESDDFRKYRDVAL